MHWPCRKCIGRNLKKGIHFPKGYITWNWNISLIWDFVIVKYLDTDTWSPQRCWHSSSVTTFSWNAFRLYCIFAFHLYCILFGFHLYCILSSDKTILWSDLHQARNCSATDLVQHNCAAQFCWTYRWVCIVLADDGECGFGRRNLPLGNSGKTDASRLWGWN